jgi:hypothetical protein
MGNPGDEFHLQLGELLRAPREADDGGQAREHQQQHARSNGEIAHPGPGDDGLERAGAVAHKQLPAPEGGGLASSRSRIAPAAAAWPRGRIAGPCPPPKPESRFVLQIEEADGGIRAAGHALRLGWVRAIYDGGRIRLGEDLSLVIEDASGSQMMLQRIR